MQPTPGKCDCRRSEPRRGGAKSADCGGRQTNSKDEILIQERVVWVPAGENREFRA
jgi:hypothetical protein